MTLAKGISSGVLPRYTKYTPADQAGPLPNLFFYNETKLIFQLYIFEFNHTCIKTRGNSIDDLKSERMSWPNRVMTTQMRLDYDFGPNVKHLHARLPDIACHVALQIFCECFMGTAGSI